MKKFCTECNKYVTEEEQNFCKERKHVVISTLTQNEVNKQLVKSSDTISKKIYEFAKNKIKKLIISETDSNVVIALIENNGHVESLDLANGKAKDWLRYSYHKMTGENHSDDAYKNTLSLMRSEAIYNETLRTTIFNRIAQLDDAIYYDLSTPDWKSVKITKDTIEIISLDESHPIFERKQHQRAQLVPTFDYENPLDELVKLLRIQGKDKQIFKVHLISMFLQRCPIPIMVFFGEHGSIKTTITRSVKRIVDPSGEPVSSLTKKTDDLIIHFSSRYLASFDNISSLNQETSDMLCRTITGEGQTKRQLYTDTNEIIFNYKRKIIFNGIFPSIEYPDLRDRTIVYETLPLSEKERITEEEFNKQFEKLLPQVLGQIFQTLQKSLSLCDCVKKELENMPRMADFAIFGESISRSLNYTPFSFIDSYRQQIELNSLDAVESYPIIKLIEKIMEDQTRYENTVSNFHNHITKLAEL